MTKHCVEKLIAWGLASTFAVEPVVALAKGKEAEHPHYHLETVWVELEAPAMNVSGTAQWSGAPWEVLEPSPPRWKRRHPNWPSPDFNIRHRR